MKRILVVLCAIILSRSLMVECSSDQTKLDLEYLMSLSDCKLRSEYRHVMQEAIKRVDQDFQKNAAAVKSKNSNFLVKEIRQWFLWHKYYRQKKGAAATVLEEYEAIKEIRANGEVKERLR